MPYADREKRLQYMRDWSKKNTARRARFDADPRLQMLYNARERAKRHGIECTLTLSDIIVPEVCPILGIRLERRLRKTGPHFASPTLDRIDLRLGYIPGNVQVISHRANRMKNDADPDELLAFARWVQQTYGLRSVSRKAPKLAELGAPLISIAEVRAAAESEPA